MAGRGGTKLIDPPEEVPYWYAKGIDVACCIILRDEARHRKRKGGHTLQGLQAHSGTLMGVVDWSEDTSIVYIYGSCEGQNLV